MDTAPDAPPDSTLDEQRPKGTPEQQLASFGADSAEAAEPEKPEEEKKATAGAERSVGVAESPEPAPSSNNETVLESRVSSKFFAPKHHTTLPRNRTGFCRRSGFPARLLIGMRRLRLKSRLPHPHSPQPPPTRSLNPKPLLRKPRSPRKTISVRKEPRRSTPPPWLSARSPAPSDVQRHDPNPQPPQRRRIHGPQPRNPF